MVALFGLSLLQAKDVQAKDVVIPPIEDSIGLYREWNAKVAKAQRVDIVITLFFNEDARDLWFYLQRPNAGSVHGVYHDIDTDGRRSRSGVGSTKGFNRPAKPDDLKTLLGRPGFESFFAPKAKVEGLGPLRVVELRFWGGSLRKAVAADLRIDGKMISLYFDAIGRTPIASGRPGEAKPYVSELYKTIALSSIRQKVRPVLPEEPRRATTEVAATPFASRV